MAGILHDLENNEAILLMYLADELGEQDRAEVEHMLGRDGGLRAELEELRAMQQGVVGGIGRLDEIEVVPGCDEAAMRRLLREMKRYQTELALRPASSESPSRFRRLPAWSYPLIGAAAVIFILLGLWGVGVIELPSPKDVTAGNLPTSRVNEPTERDIARNLEASLETDSSQAALDAAGDALASDQNPELGG
jgi:anti-sigma factor RsiW